MKDGEHGQIIAICSHLIKSCIHYLSVSIGHSVLLSIKPSFPKISLKNTKMQYVALF
jgi:hypothetical protein